VIVLSIPATESYQVTLSDSFFSSDQATADITSRATKNYARDSGMTSVSLSTVDYLNENGLPSDLAPVDMQRYLNNHWMNSIYQMSPFIAWSHNTSNFSVNSLDSSQWPGLNTASKDLQSLFSNTNTSTSNGSRFENI
jgi:hypothetical protein